MPGNLLVLNPTILSRRDSINLTEPTRKLPIVTESQAFNEPLRLKLPEGFTIDELPAPVDLKTAFGSYRADCSAKDGGLVYQRSFVLENAVIPAEQYEEVRRFFVSIRDAEQSPVVLVETRQERVRE